ncbi:MULTISPECIES: dihydrolipoamide acetyltransferase family protein [unclassified Flavobacterium]|jgi:2-oxoglutarate dehydrogenase E2 component (dihydrolipoamide succinyltransferase)|uniref:dihydrolipoamide acetyltransferase family protein n=1 Tax=unclassified Flavobacterium TaxID=196869 RepID=UPI0012A9DBE5|nr:MULTISPECIES: dihydrolipoamide acetyltransferase family protein [unclassified Flavobacterium]MBF4486460.1 2-oxo acid dehydrogenase subunit E2 [Flavobacterium sp. CSZ]QGK72583.1 2-oxo acid dehydrogenase subunit E2 [Flavobacterium sp. SLB02]
MARFELKLPKMGESVAEATITNWLKEVGDKIEADEAVLEIATDKVDSEVPSEVSGILVEQLFGKDDLVQVGQTIAIIETEGDAPAAKAEEAAAPAEVAALEATIETAKETVAAPQDFSGSDKFFSPLVKNIAKEEGISVAELESIAGSGKDGRVTKEDILKHIENRKSGVETPKAVVEAPRAVQPVAAPVQKSQQAVPVSVNGSDEIIEMDRMRKLISGYMTASVQTSAHVQSFIEVDVTNIVKWREKVKTAFEKREGEKLTFTPIMMEAVAKALKDFPGMNISVDGDYIIKKKNINLGMAAALPNGNLIVPVIKNADQLNLVGMAKAVNDLGNRAKAGKLKPDDTQGGTYTVTNVGTFGSVFGTPIINQPQVGILALGAIRKVPAVIETPEGDFIGIRQKMFLSHSYDHRVVDGALGGSFVKRVAEYLEAFDIDRDF